MYLFSFFLLFQKSISAVCQLYRRVEQRNTKSYAAVLGQASKCYAVAGLGYDTKSYGACYAVVGRATLRSTKCYAVVSKAKKSHGACYAVVCQVLKCYAACYTVVGILNFVSCSTTPTLRCSHRLPPRG